MKNYVVYRHALYFQKIYVEAESEEEAVQKAALDDGDDIVDIEYIETLENYEDWDVKEV